MRNKTIDLNCATPEDLLGVRSNVAPGGPADAISIACDRAMAVLYLLSGQFSGDSEAGRYSDAIIFNAITDVQGTLENIRTLAQYGGATSRPAGGER